MKRTPKEIAQEEGKKLEDEQKGINYGLIQFRKENPEFAKEFTEFWRTSKRGKYIPLKYRELMELAVVIVEHCKPCIYVHVDTSLKAGATREEIVETAQVAIAMGGGIAYEYIGYVFEALNLKQGKDRKA